MMPMLFLAVAMLIVSDLPRLLPNAPATPTRWMEQGNRHARRRDEKLRRRR